METLLLKMNQNEQLTRDSPSRGERGWDVKNHTIPVIMKRRAHPVLWE
jgi:hypothetical protein